MNSRLDVGTAAPGCPVAQVHRAASLGTRPYCPLPKPIQSNLSFPSLIYPRRRPPLAAASDPSGSRNAFTSIRL
jgi:hypothetical protein